MNVLAYGETEEGEKFKLGNKRRVSAHGGVLILEAALQAGQVIFSAPRSTR
jgi:hypothetical protein